jgi:membrane-associated phospholipid phosphatase
MQFDKLNFQKDFGDSQPIVFLEKFGDIGCWILPSIVSSLAYFQGYRCIPAGIVIIGLAQKHFTTFLKSSCPKDRPRPFIYGKISKQDTESFPSSHTAGAFLSVGLSYALYDLNTYTITCFALSALVGLSRILSQKHWPSDVLAGAAIGFTCGALCGKVFA